MDPSQRRFQNDQQRAKQSAVGAGPGKQAAQNSVRPTADNRINQLVGPRQSAATPMHPNAPTPVRPKPAPVIHPDGYGPPPETFDQKTDNLMRQVRFSKLMTSPEAQDANTIISLRNFWNDRDIDDNRTQQFSNMMLQYAPPAQ